MSSLLMCMWLATAPVGPCYLATDSTPGWKHVTLPDDARSLSAPAEIDQFRSDEFVTIVDERKGVYLQGRSDRPGVTAFDLALGEGGRSLEVRFGSPLRGAKVDVTATSSSGTLALMREERVAGQTLFLSWGENDVQSVTVRVHDHLRKEPVLLGWKSVRRVRVEKLRASSGFQLKRSLYYRQPPGGASVPLCHEPSVELSIAGELPGREELPMPVAIKRL